MYCSIFLFPHCVDMDCYFVISFQIDEYESSMLVHPCQGYKGYTDCLVDSLYDSFRISLAIFEEEVAVMLTIVYNLF